MNQGRRYQNDAPSHLKCPSCNFRFQYPGTISRRDDTVAKEKLRVPYVLSCGHSYCLLCVEKKLQSSFHVFCTKCKISTHVVGNISDNLSIDFTTIGRIISARSQIHDTQNHTKPDNVTNGDSGDFLCQDCSLTTARKLCLECCVYFCNPCYQRIHYRGYMSQHNTVPMCKSGIIGSREKCDSHPAQFLDYHCIDCAMNYCIKCDMTKRRHINHKICPLTEMFKRNMKQLQGLSPRIDKLLNKTKRLDDNRSGVQEKTIVDEIRGRFSQLHGILLQKEEEMIRLCLLPNGPNAGGSLHDETQYLSLLNEDIRCLSNTRPCDIHIKSEEAAARVVMAEQMWKFRISAPNQFSFELDASRFETLLRECIKAPSHLGPLEIASQNSGLSSCSELSSQPSITNVVEVVEPDVDDPTIGPVFESHTTLPPLKPIKDGTSREYVKNLSIQPRSVLSGTLADGDRVSAIHVVNPSQIYLHKTIDADQIQSLFNVCQDLGRKGAALSSTRKQELEPGDMLLAEYSVDHNWYRCRILCTFVLCGGLRCRPGTVLVIFVDYGNSECVRLDHLKELPPQLENVSNFAYACNLNLLPPSKTWLQKTSLAVRDVLESDKPFVVRILNQKGDVSFMDLCRPIEQGLGPFSLREHLVLRKLARYPEGDCERPVDYKQDEDASDLSVFDINNPSLASTALPPTPSSNPEEVEMSLDDADDTVVDCSEGSVLEMNAENSSSLLLPVSGRSSTDVDVTVKIHLDELSLENSTKNDALCETLTETYADIALTDDPDQTSLHLSEISAMVNGALDGSETVDEDEESFLAHKQASQVELPNGISVNAICVCHDSLNKVWVTPEQIQSMAFEANHPALVADTKWTSPPLVGGLYASRYNDDFFYRCVVEALVGQDQASVFFVDFGNQEVVNWRSDMTRLSKRFLMKPYMARLLILAGITFEHKELTCDLVNQVQDLILSDNTYQLRYERSVPGGDKDSSAIYLLRKASCVNLQLVEHHLADFTSLQQEILMRGLLPKENRRAAANGKGRAAKSSSLTMAASSAFRTRESNGRRPRAWDGSSTVGVMAQEEEPADSALSSAWEDDLSDEELCRLSTMRNCCLQRVVSPNEFYISMNDPDTAKELDKLYLAMDEFYNAKRMAPPRAVSKLPVGSFCAARRSNSKHWFRGRIVGPSASGSRHVKVEFVDVGDVLNIPLSSIRQPLNRNLMCSWHAFAVRCRLLGVRPAGDKSSEWPQTAVEKLTELVKRSDNKAFLSRLIEDEDGPAVDLILKEHIFDPEKEEETNAKPVCSRLVSLRRSMINLGVALSKGYDAALLRDNDYVLRGPLLVPPPDLESASSPEDARSSSEEDSDLEEHLYQSNNSNTAPAITAQPETSCSALSVESCAEVLYSVDLSNKEDAVVSPPQKTSPRSEAECQPDEVSADVPLDILRIESIDSTDGPLDAYRAVFWPPYEVEPDSDEIQAQVLNIDGSLTIFCKPLIGCSEEVAEEKVNSFAEHFRLPPKKSVQSWDISEACLTLWKRGEKEIWCRGQVETLNSIANNATVYLIDYGKSINVPNDLLRPIRVSYSGEKHPLLDVPPSVWRVKLHEIFPVNPHNTDDLNYRLWSQECINQLREDFLTKIVTLFVVEVMPSNFGLPYLYCRILCPDVDFVEELGERLVSKQIAYRWELDNEDQRFIKTPDIFRCYSNLDPMPVGIPLEVIITAVETPSEVYLQCPVLPHQLGALCSQYPAHKTWFQAASEAYESLSSTDYENTTTPFEAGENLPMPCLARYSADHRFYRADLCYVVENSARYRVQFVDYGNFDVVSWNDLRAPQNEHVPACSRRYRWGALKRHPSCDLSRAELRRRILDTLEPLVIFAKCERIYRDGRLPLVHLYGDAECTQPLVDLLIEKQLLVRK